MQKWHISSDRLDRSLNRYGMVKLLQLDRPRQAIDDPADNLLWNDLIPLWFWDSWFINSISWFDSLWIFVGERLFFNRWIGRDTIQILGNLWLIYDSWILKMVGNRSKMAEVLTKVAMNHRLLLWIHQLLWNIHYPSRWFANFLVLS